MADGVSAAGHEIKIVTPDEKGLTQVALERGWEVMVVPYRFCSLPLWKTGKDKIMFLPRLAKTILYNLKARGKVIKFAQSFGPDIIHDNTSVIDVGHYAAKRLNIPHIIHIREYGWKDFRLVLPGLKSRLNYSKSAIIGITRDLTSMRGKHLPPERKCTIYNGIVKRKEIKYDSEKEPFFFYAGRIQFAKGVSELIDAYINYCKFIISKNEKPLKLILAGSTTNEMAFFKQQAEHVRNAGLEDYVEWLGEISNVEDYMAKAAATVIPSYWEGFGRVMPEAMAAGSLCIARNTGGTAEQLSNGKNMLGRRIALEFNDSEDLTAKLLEVDKGYKSNEAYNPGGQYEKLIKDSQNVIESLYLSENVGNKTLDFYNQVLKLWPSK